MADSTFFARGESKSNYETLTREQILAAITQAVSGGTIGDIDTGFVTKIKEQNHGNELRFWVGTSAEYNALVELEEIENNVLYIKTDDTSAAEISGKITEFSEAIETILGYIDRLFSELSENRTRITALEAKTYTPVGGIMLTNTDISTAEEAAAAAGFGTWEAYGTLAAAANTINCWLRTA